MGGTVSVWLFRFRPSAAFPCLHRGARTREARSGTVTMKSSESTSGSAPRRRPAARAFRRVGDSRYAATAARPRPHSPALERLGEIAAGVSPEGSREDEGRSREELRAGRCSQNPSGPGDSPRRRDQGKDRQEGEERVGGDRGRDGVESAGRPEEGNLREALAEAGIGRILRPLRAGRRWRTRGRLRARRGKRGPLRPRASPCRPESPERPLVGRREECQEDDEGRGERGARTESGQDGCHRNGDCRVSVLATCGTPDASFVPRSGPAPFRASSLTRWRRKRPAEAVGGKDTGPPRQLSSDQ